MLPAALLAPDAAVAAGGAHAIDDSEVEAPGDCHFETWVTGMSGDQWHVHGGVGCTPEAVPALEIGGWVSHLNAPGFEETMIGIAPKLNLRRAESGLGIALAGSLSYGLDRSRIETASLIATATVPASEGLNLNFNAGWTWAEAGSGSELFGGAQAEWAVGSGISVMAEGFARNNGKAGGQAGIRWTSGDGRIDVDLLAARYPDGATPTAVTAGLTVRR